MTATLIIEEALRSYVPATPTGELRPGFVRKGRIIVGTGRHRLTVDDVQASIDETRNGVRD